MLNKNNSEQREVVFVNDDNVEKIMVRDGEKLKKTKEPTKKRFKFLGWYIDEIDPSTGKVKSTLWDFEKPVTSNIVLNSHWKKKFNVLLFFLIVLLVGLLSTSGWLIWNRYSTPAVNPNVFPPIVDDPNVEELPSGNSSTLEKPQGGGAITITASNVATAKIGDDFAKIMYQNPSQSREGIVLQIHITDEELIKHIGKTGRTGKDKKSIEEAEGYNPKTSRLVIAESGLIKPGKVLNEIKLKKLSDGTVLPKGEYNAIFYILPYDLDTNERAVVNTQIPIKLTIEN